MKKIIIILCLCIGLVQFIGMEALADNDAKSVIDDAVKKAMEATGKPIDDSTEETKEDDGSLEDGDFDYRIIADYFARQEEYENAFKEKAEVRISEYWNAELIGIDVYLDDAYIYGESEKEHISTMNVKLRWNVETNAERTRNMLSSYSDDIAATLHSIYPEIPIDRMHVLWEVPYILKSGYAAKIQYYSIGDAMFCSDRYGILFGRM